MTLIGVQMTLAAGLTVKSAVSGNILSDILVLIHFTRCRALAAAQTS